MSNPLSTLYSEYTNLSMQLEEIEESIHKLTSRHQKTSSLYESNLEELHQQKKETEESMIQFKKALELLGDDSDSTG